jgi:hypothetical protein
MQRSQNFLLVVAALELVALLSVSLPQAVCTNAAARSSAITTNFGALCIDATALSLLAR